MRHTPSDHALAIIKAGLNVVPYVGGAIASLIGDYVPTSTQKSIEHAINLLREQLINLGDRVDADTVNKDEFADLFKSCYLIIVRTAQEEKLQAAAALLANLLLKSGDPAKSSYTELDHFVRCLDYLSIGAITVLGASRRVVSAAQPDLEGNLRFNFEQLRNILDRIEPSLLMGLVGELNAFNLLRVAGQPAVVTPHYGNYPLQLTPLGMRFVERVIEGKLPAASR